MSANIYRTSSGGGGAGHHHPKRRKLNSTSATTTTTTTTVSSTNPTKGQNHHHIVTNHTSPTATQVMAVSSREQRIHHPTTLTNNDTIVPLSSSFSKTTTAATTDNDDMTTSSSLFAIELEVAYERNKSEVFQRFYSAVWPLVRTMPEVLHHRTIIVQHMMQYLLSPSSSSTSNQNNHPKCDVMNFATLDILHLLGVLARELRHEMHPFLHTVILPKLLYDLLNPSLTIMAAQTALEEETEPERNENEEEEGELHHIDNEQHDEMNDIADMEHHDDENDDENDDSSTLDQTPPPPILLDVATIQFIFRTIAYLLKYDQAAILQDTTDAKTAPTTNGPDPSSMTAKIVKHSIPCCDAIRQYYTVTICHPNAFVRRLSAETFAPLLRQLSSSSSGNTNNNRKKNPLVKHIRRTLRALSYNNSTKSETNVTKLNNQNAFPPSKPQSDAPSPYPPGMDGIAYLWYEISRNGTRFHTKCGKLLVHTLLDELVEYSTTPVDACTRNPQLVVHVIRTTFHLWCHHIDIEPIITNIIETIIDTVLHKLLVQTNRRIEHESALIVTIQILQYFFSHQNGSLLQHDPQPGDHRLLPMLQSLLTAHQNRPQNSTSTVSAATILEPKMFRAMNSTCQEATLQLVYTLLKHLDHRRQKQFFHRLVGALSAILTIPIHSATNTGNRSDDVGGQSITTVAHHVIQHCLPHMSSNIHISMRTIGSAIIRTAIQLTRDATTNTDATKAPSRENFAVTLLHGLVSVRMRDDSRSNRIKNDEDDFNSDVLFLDRAISCHVPVEIYTRDIPVLLNQICHDNMNGTLFDTELNCANVVAACKVSSFLVALGLDGPKISEFNENDSDDDEDSRNIDMDCDDGRVGVHEEMLANYKRVSKWHIDLIERIDKIHTQRVNNGKSVHSHSGTVLSMSIESLSCLSILVMRHFTRFDVSTMIKSTLLSVQSIALRHLFANPSNLWVLKSTAKFIRALNELGLNFNTDQLEDRHHNDDIFEALLPCLRSRYHFHRLPALQILSSVPKRPFVVDHAELDLHDDLDEEQDTSAPTTATKTSTSYAGLSGPCNLIDLLLSIESMPVNMQTERTLISNITRIGVLGRTGKLPVIYAEAAVSHMIGLLNVKFSPIWSVAVKSLIDLTRGHENCVWPALHQQIATFMTLYPSTNQQHHNEHYDDHTEICNDDEPSDQLQCPIDPIGLYACCRSWEISNGSDKSLFTHDIQAAEEQGRVSRHHSSDESSVVTSLWGVIQGAPMLLTAHSRTIVPIFLQFIYYQYYAVHKNDPDSRELDILTTLQEINGNENNGSKLSLSGRQVQQRLLCIVKAFASVNGPQQLYKHKLLLSIFLSFLGSQDNILSQTAFSFVLKFKLPYLVHYSDTLKKLYEKGMLRDALMQLNSDVEEGKIHSDHRQGLIPVISRILFGRLSSRGGGGSKSSKDSPSARRTAVVSFLSSFCHDDDELYPFLYLMMRVYIPTNFTMHPIEMQDKDSHREIMKSITDSESFDYNSIPVQVHQGFLNVLEAVISQLGRKMVPFVPTFMSIVFKLCKTYEVKGKDEYQEFTTIQDARTESNDDETSIGPNSRSGSVRSLCYTRLANIFAIFSDIIDISQYKKSLWESLDQSLLLLPVMVLNSDKVPSLLYMLRVMSGETSLVSMLTGNDHIVPSVLMCLSASSKSVIIETVLIFIDNLLGFEDGRILLHHHIDLMLDQFASRMGCAPMSPIRSSNGKSKQHPKGQNTWRRELSILCKVSELVDENVCSSIVSKSSKAMETMCELLIPYLDINRGIPDPDKQRILDILEVMIVKVSPASAADHYVTLAALLGPFKAKSGILSRTLRKSLATVLSCIANTAYPTAIPSTALLNRLCAVSIKRIDEMDYDLVIPAISDLGSTSGEVGWLNLCCSNAGSTEPFVLLPLMYTCFNFMFDDDGVVSRGSFNALMVLVSVASREVTAHASDTWKKFLEGSIVPLIKSGICSHVEFTRRFYILLLKEIIQRNAKVPSPMLFSDLSCLIRDDEPDLDFFHNITHVQLHRRARALQRLRKMLIVDSDEAAVFEFSLQSLSNVLLPIATHPIYESKTKLDENFALEGIATVGAISRHLSWSKYNSLLWNHLTQFERHPELEKYLIGLICAIIDGFHFQIDAGDKCVGDNNNKSTSATNAIWRALENRIIPKIEQMMVKDKTGKKGAMLRPMVLLALHKLVHKLPTDMFQSKLPRLLAVVCDGLRNKESDARDVARISLAKMVVEMDLMYLSDVLRELATSLNEGYKLHVRNATIHTILLEVAKVYNPPDAVDPFTLPVFDKSVPALMDLIQQDIFGEAQERRDAQGNQVRFVKEAGGAKSANSLELIASMILFRPTQILEASSVHMLVTPLLERIRSPGVSTTVTRRIKECLARIVSGLLRNPSLQNESVIQFVYATLEPFVSKHEIGQVMELMDDDISSDEDDPVKPIHVSGKRKTTLSDGARDVKGHVVEWRPSTIKLAKTRKAARRDKEQLELESFKVLDGASAPKLTGSSRMTTATKATSNSVNDTATVCAVVFGLQLLSPMLKNWNESNSKMDSNVLDRFVPLLTTCVCRCRNTDVVLMALRCLGFLLKTDLPSLARCSKSLATKTLDLITSAGSNQEMLQATFKMLTFLISYDRKVGGIIESGDNPLAGKSLPLNDEQLQVLLSFLRESVTSSDHYNAAIALIKSIMSRRYVSVEFYDLMETMLEQSVRSSKSTLRDQSGIVFLHYLINYPLSAEKIEQHLKQIVLNISYQYAEGRISAITLASMILDKLPQPVVEKHCQLIFFPLTLQLVNDDSQECRELVAKCLGKLMRNVSIDVLHTLFDFVKRWSDGDISLQRMSLQLLKILVETRPDYVKRNDTARTIVQKAQSLMDVHVNDWEMQYFSLLLVEAMMSNFNHHVIASISLWEGIVDAMVNDHIWVKTASVRLLSNHIHALDPNELTSSQSFIMTTQSGLLFRLARNLCYQLGVDESQQNDDMTAMAVKALTWTIQAAATHPTLCIIQGEEKANTITNDDAPDDDSVDGHSTDDQVTENTNVPNPVQWIMTRLSNLARLKGAKRRQSIFKCFAAFITLLPSKDVMLYPYLEKIIEPLHRVDIETKNDTTGGEVNTTNYLMLLSKRSSGDTLSEEGQLAKDVLQLLETHCMETNNSDLFLKAYSNVQNRSKERKERRKSHQKLQVITNPAFAAQRRMDKQVREKHRRQRRVQERRVERGAGTSRRNRDA